MRKIVVFTLVYSFLTTYAVGEKQKNVTALGEPLGPLGPNIVERPHNATKDAESIYIGMTIHVDLSALNATERKKYTTLAKFLANRTLAQRLALRDAFQKLYGKNVVDYIRKHLDPDYAYFQLNDMNIFDFYYALFSPVPEFLANKIDESLSRAKDWNYMSIICTSSATKLKAINEAYKKSFQNKVLSDTINEKLKEKEGINVMRQMLDPQFMRPDFGTDSSKVEEQISLIPNKTVPCKSKKLFEFMTSASFEQIRLVANAYPQKPYNFNQAVVDRFRQHCPKGDMQEAYKRIVRYAVDPYRYLAEEFRLGEDGNEYHYNSNIIVLISRCEVDFRDVLAAYKQAYGQDLLEKATKTSTNHFSPEEIYYAIIVGNTNNDDN